MPANLVIVESPAKAKTIKKFLGKDFAVEASMGHVRDLQEKKLSVDVKNNYEPTYEIPEGKKTVIKNLQKAMKTAEHLWIATDEDREGEAIGWHLLHALKVPVKEHKSVKRIVFHEITKEAIEAAIGNPRTIDQKLVEAQQARRILDRLVGYTLSPFLWAKVYRGLSAGRVQSVAVRIIVDREKEIQAFKSDEYWTIDAELQTSGKEIFQASLTKLNGKKYVPDNEKDATAVVEAVQGKKFSVHEIEEKKVQKNPSPPYTTSTLQQDASNKLGFSVKQTMVVAQQLYEGVNLGKGEGQTGLITYMRTDSVNLSAKALTDSEEMIQKLFGREYILSKPRTFQTKSKNAQEAHEAIRPTELHRTPESLAGVLDDPQLKLYTLIWKRTMATQMPAAELKRVGADIAAAEYMFRATGQTVEFDGYLRVYEEEDDTQSLGEKFLPKLAEGQELTCTGILPEQHFTQPPARYTEASLVKKLEEEGIGRPSTYAPTISTVQQRGYIRKDGRQLIPETVAFTVTDLLIAHFPDIVDLKFTAKVEDSLDEIATGKVEWVPFMDSFFKPFSALIEKKKEEVKKEDVLKEAILGNDPKTGFEVIVRTGRFGNYVQLGRPEDYKGTKNKPKSASLPKGIVKEEATLEQALSLLSFPRILGEKDGQDVSANLGRFGPYLRWGTVTVTLPPEVDPTHVTLQEAETLIAEAAEKRKQMAEPIQKLGADPTSSGEILVKTGRYGPYVTDGKTNASLGKKFDPKTLTRDEAIEILVKKRARGPGRKWGKKK
ncbi:MAG TPA: type I DNA topoisomerase [Candidatus Peribacterales bacterium]|nr:type I DNA topoisomerase [Candidatus Peribacterales bacterium]